MKNITIVIFFLFQQVLSGQHVIKLFPNEDPHLHVRFGEVIAVSNDYLAIRSLITESENSSTIECVYIASFNNGDWEIEARLTAPDPTLDQCFGCDIDIHGQTVIIGAPGYTGSIFQVGRAYVFRKTGAEWLREAEILSSDASLTQNFGLEVAIYGERLAVSASRDSVENIPNAGSVYIFERNEDLWQEVTKVVASDPEQNAGFGREVDMGEDYIYVSAPRASNEDNLKVGAIYSFTDIDGEWTQLQKVTSEINSNHSSGGFFRLINQGSEVGAFSTYRVNGQASGVIGHFFVHDNGELIEQSQIILQNEGSDARGWAFGGEHVAMAFDDASVAGPIHLYRKNNDTWDVISMIEEDNADFLSFYAYKMELNDQYLFVSDRNAYYNNDANSTRTGGVYIYNLDKISNSDDLPPTDINFSIFPNPVEETLYVKIDSSLFFNMKRLELYSTRGQLIWRRFFEEENRTEAFTQWQISMNNWPSGLYTLRGVLKEGVFTKQVVKM